MNREQLIQKLDTLANEALANGQKAVAGTIFSLLGAMQSNSEMALFLHVCKFSENEIKRLSAARN